MTANQLTFMANKEQARSNREKEFETHRSNVAKEEETHRTNVAHEAETYRSNTAKEQATMYDLVNKYLMQQAELNESRRHNISYEAIQRGNLQENRRHNRQVESETVNQNRITEEHYKANDFMYGGQVAGNILGTIGNIAVKALL